VFQYLLLQSVVVPLIAAGLCYLAAPKLGKRVGWIAFVSLFLTTLLLVGFGWSQLFSGGRPISESYTWAPTAGLTFGFLADGLSFPVAILVNLVLAATAVYSMPYMENSTKVCPKAFGSAVCALPSNGRYWPKAMKFRLAALIIISTAKSRRRAFLFVTSP